MVEGESGELRWREIFEILSQQNKTIIVRKAVASGQIAWLIKSGKGHSRTERLARARVVCWFKNRNLQFRIEQILVHCRRVRFRVFSFSEIQRSKSHDSSMRALQSESSTARENKKRCEFFKRRNAIVLSLWRKISDRNADRPQKMKRHVLFVIVILPYPAGDHVERRDEFPLVIFRQRKKKPGKKTKRTAILNSRQWWFIFASSFSSLRHAKNASLLPYYSFSYWAICLYSSIFQNLLARQNHVVEPIVCDSWWFHCLSVIHCVIYESHSPLSYFSEHFYWSYENRTVVFNRIFLRSGSEIKISHFQILRIPGVSGRTLSTSILNWVRIAPRRTTWFSLFWPGLSKLKK